MKDTNKTKRRVIQVAVIKLNLSSKPMPLHIARRQVVVKVEPDFADCLDLRFAFCNLAESFQHRLVHQLRIVRMHSNDRIAPRVEQTVACALAGV